MISIPAAGGYNQLQYQELTEDSYTQGANIRLKGIDTDECVIVQTHACGVNYADICIRLGVYSSAKEFVGWPITPGFEFSGTVLKVGNNVKDFEPGDEVFGFTMFGGYSQRISVPHNQIRKIPKNITLSQAAGFLCTGATAWYAVVESCKLRKNDIVLVHSAAGGVGSMIVQMTKMIGCKVVGVVGSSHKVNTATELGCEHVIDKSKENLWKRAKTISEKGYKAIFDANGIETLQESYNHLSQGGRLVCYGFATMLPRSSETKEGSISMFQWLNIGWKHYNTPKFSPMSMVTENKNVLAFNLSYMFDETILIDECFNDLCQWITNGTLRIPKVTEYQLKDSWNAHKDLESGTTVGKLVLLTHPENSSEENKS